MARYVLINSKTFRVTPESVPAGTQQDVFSAAQKDLSSPKSLAIRADNLTFQSWEIKFLSKRSLAITRKPNKSSKFAK